MEKQELTHDKETFEKAINYLGDPPCYNCIVKAMCFNATIDEFGGYEIILCQPCDAGYEWICLINSLCLFIFCYKELPDGLLGIEDIKTIIRLRENENTEDLARRFNVEVTEGEDFDDFEDFIIQLNELLSNFSELSIMREFIIPFVEDQLKMLKEKAIISVCD
ncbi:hypothetical protein ACFL36_05600 [Thermodesulfobacteriota bacterium]